MIRSVVCKIARRVFAVARFLRRLPRAIPRLIAIVAERNSAIAQRNQLVIQRDEIIRYRDALANGEGNTQLQREYLIHNYWAAHPRYVFFKSLPKNAALLDIGSGSGGIALWREWGNPYRRDLRLFGFDLPPDANNHEWKSTHFDLYEKWQYGDLETTPLEFEDDFFDGAMASNVLEHLKRPLDALRALFGKLKPGARVYIEIPTIASKALPTARDLAARGMPVMVANFYDDSTHVDTYSLTTLADMARSIGLVVEGGGVVRHPFLEEAMWRYGLDHDDSELLLYGYWSITSWVQYMVMSRPRDGRHEAGGLREMIGDRSPGADIWL